MTGAVGAIIGSTATSTSVLTTSSVDLDESASARYRLPFELPDERLYVCGWSNSRNYERITLTARSIQLTLVGDIRPDSVSESLRRTP